MCKSEQQILLSDDKNPLGLWKGERNKQDGCLVSVILKTVHKIGFPNSQL